MMIHAVTFLVGFSVGLVLAGLFEQRAVREVLSLRTYLRAELQKLAVRL
jgi:hypothetical protein